jgi:hypothetical protein
MTAESFRRMALSFPDTSEQSHMDHPDFRVRGKIFATLGCPDENWAMVKLWPEEQQNFVGAEPAVFMPVNGAWGGQGCTNVYLKRAGPGSVRKSLAAAWRRAAPKSVAAKAV